MGIAVENGWFGTVDQTEFIAYGIAWTALVKTLSIQSLALLTIIVEIVLLLPQSRTNSKAEIRKLAKDSK